ncbi:MAG TPA: PEPxxWA-CTERM sorting domain-containing protein [Caulobacteraceae bacterium]
MKTLTGIGAAAVMLAAALGAQAGTTPALSYSLNTGEALGNGPFTLGWEFTVNTTVTVYDLGVFDDSLDGLAVSHDVGIWDSGGALLTSATVAAGTVDPLFANFRYVGITPITLTPGTYTIGAVWTNSTDNMVFTGDSGVTTTDPSITYLQTEYVAGGTLAFPTSTAGGPPGYYGPDFTLSALTVPEPVTWALVFLGFGGVGATMRKARSDRARSLRSA